MRNPSYSHELDFIKKQIGISAIINPEMAAAREISQLLRFPGASKIDTFAEGRVRLIKFTLTEAQALDGVAIRELSLIHILTGLSVGFAFKTGLFNIGAAGQYTLGAYGALYCAIMLKLPWFVCLLVATILGGIWGAIPGFFKAYFNINEVITNRPAS